jgi:hypothetical protein
LFSAQAYSKKLICKRGNWAAGVLSSRVWLFTKEPCGQDGRLLALRTSSLTTLIEVTSSGTIIRELTAILSLLLVFMRR